MCVVFDFTSLFFTFSAVQTRVSSQIPLSQMVNLCNYIVEIALCSVALAVAALHCHFHRCLHQYIA